MNDFSAIFVLRQTKQKQKQNTKHNPEIYMIPELRI